MGNRSAGTTRGVTLVEVLLAVFILVAAGSGILGSYLACHQLSEHATSTMRAVDHLEDVMEHIESTPFDTLQTFFPGGVVDGGANDYEGIVGGYTLDNEQIVVTYPSQTTGRLEMLVTVNWAYRGRTQSTSLSTVRTDGSGGPTG